MKATKLFLALLLLSALGTIKAQNITFSAMKTIVEFSDYAPAGNYIAALGYDHKTIEVREKDVLHTFKSLKVSCVWNDDKHDYEYYNSLNYYSSNSPTGSNMVSFGTKCSYQYKNLLNEIIAQGFYVTDTKTMNNGSKKIIYKSESHPGLEINTIVADTDTEDIFAHIVVLFISRH